MTLTINISKEIEGQVYRADVSAYKKCDERKKVSNGFGYKYIRIKNECICPTKQSFRCGKYCTTNSDTCDYLMSYFGHIYFSNIKQCSIVQKFLSKNNKFW